TSLTALQCELRELFANRPSNRALAETLQVISRRLGAIYAVVHTRLGVHVLSEEWGGDDDTIDTDDRERINQALWESVASEEARCVRLKPGTGSLLLLTVVMYDHGAEPSGGAALVLPACDRAHILQVMAQLEGVLGYVSLLFDQGNSATRRSAERREMRPTEEADHPMRLAYAILGDLEARYGLELAAVGFVQRTGVQVAAMSGVDDVRASNPGVMAIRSAMEECLDRGEPIVFRGRDADGEDDCRLHAQWSERHQGNAVASLPLVFMDRTVAVVSMSQGGGSKLTRDQVVLMQEELSGYAALVPLSLTANRTLRRHAADLVRQTWQRVMDRGLLRTATVATAVLTLLLWLAFGSMHHTFTVPCTVKATDRRTIACPRAGVLAELFVRPGDRVQQGQLLAAIDASDDFLQRAELTAEIEALAALIDQAVGEREAGQVRVNEAKKRSLEAQLAIVDASIAQAQIRAPHDGLILEGDLRERLGSRLDLGVPLFELARYDRASIELRIPERMVLAANECVSAEFAPAAEPDRGYLLENLTIAPSSTIVDEQNVFLGEADVEIDLGLLPPGMEGTARVDAGARSAWWVLTHRITDWLHLNFWL
ncbi:MAG: biotin/lipoyl-binding protein, partial [Planctomycetes bacterium]|nr:biotin/lipoyl-binding protein [Planctomycetota bacterium]